MGILQIWKSNRDFFGTKSLPQILSITGDGRLKDNNDTSKEFKELLEVVPSSVLNVFADSCLTEKFEDGGFALQDIINQIGRRLGFAVTFGLYRGRHNDIGFDGIWTGKDGHSIVIEVKTTDSYRINLDTIASYRSKLVQSGRVDKEQSSILIIVGRQDTGDLEAQIRGSKHAWDIRLISTEALLNLLALKESLNDTKTIQQINELLKPKEYTRIDKLIKLIFATSQDLTSEDDVEDLDKNSGNEEHNDDAIDQSKTSQVKFHELCIDRVGKHLNVALGKQSRIAYSNVENSIGVICTISKQYAQGRHIKYWYAFHPYQLDFLSEFKTSYVVYGCGSPENILLIPFSEFSPLLSHMWTTAKSDRVYWHVNIHFRGGKYLLGTPKDDTDMVDVTRYLI